MIQRFKTNIKKLAVSAHVAVLVLMGAMIPIVLGTVGDAVTSIMVDGSNNVLGGPFTFSNVVSQTTSATLPNHLVRYGDFTNSVAGATNGFVKTLVFGSATISNAVTGGFSNTLSLVNTAVTPATYGSSTAYPSFAVDQQGRITAASNITVTASGGGGDVFQASNNVFTAQNLISLGGTLTMGTNAVLTSYTNYNLIVNALKSDGRNALFYPKGGFAGVSSIMFGVDATTAYSTTGGYLGTNGVIAYENGNMYIDSPNNGYLQLQRGNNASIRISATVLQVSQGSLLYLGSGNGPAYIGNQSFVSTITSSWPANTNGVSTNYTLYAQTFGGSVAPVMGQIVTNQAWKHWISLTFTLTPAAATDSAAAAIAIVRNGATNIFCKESVQPIVSPASISRTVNFMVGNGQIWWATNLSTGTATATVDTNSFGKFTD